LRVGCHHQNFADDPSILGRTLRINDEPYSIIGVVPDAIPIWMAGQRRAPAQIWTPFTPYAKFFDESLRGDRGVYNLARLKLGVTIQEAETDLNLVSAVSCEHATRCRSGRLRLVIVMDPRKQSGLSPSETMRSQPAGSMAANGSPFAKAALRAPISTSPPITETR
jgi:hypothetical protein